MKELIVVVSSPNFKAERLGFTELSENTLKEKESSFSSLGE